MTEATVVGLRLCVGSRDPMKIVDDATVITGEGIEGDRHRRADGRRTCLLYTSPSPRDS